MTHATRRRHVVGLSAVYRLANIAVAIVVVACGSRPAPAAPFTAGNVLVASQQKVIEYTPAGTAVQTFDVPRGGGDGGLRDLMVDARGNVQMYNGTFTPVLTQFNPATNTFTHQPGAFSTANNLTYGGLAVAGGFVYVTDMDTNGSPSVGLTRYAVDGGPTSVIAGGSEYIDVTLGRNNKLYAVRYGGPNAGGIVVDAFDPVTGAALGSINLEAEVRAIAVDADGELFGVDLFNPITRFDSAGHIVKTLTDTVGGLADIDIDAKGNLVLASHSGEIAFTTTALASLTGFNHRHQTDLGFVAWADPGRPVPEPSSGILVVMVAAGVALRRRRRTLSR